MPHNRTSSKQLAFHSILMCCTFVVTACGGGTNAVETIGTANGSGSTGGIVGVIQTAATGCPAGIGNTTAAAVGALDPLASAAWHLQNTGPNQIVSATGNSSAVPGIDANVTAVHANGNGCTGSGVTIAVVDTGLEIGHEDLSPNVVATSTAQSYDFTTTTHINDPSPALNMQNIDHGTAVAGVAAARGWNGKGSRGTAPSASLVGYAIVGVTPTIATPSEMETLGFGAYGSITGGTSAVTSFGTRANGVSVFNYSAGSDYAAPPASTALDSLTMAAQYGTANLRGGKGAVYLQAAGNEFTDQNGSLANGTSLAINCQTTLNTDYPSGGSNGTFTNVNLLTCGSTNQEPNGKPWIYQIASMNNTGVASTYSNAGASNWIAGFGGEFGTTTAAIVTTDNSTCNSGANNTTNQSNSTSVYQQFVANLPNGVQDLIKIVADSFGVGTTDPNCNYTGQMNGTSAATPSVAGVVALVLQANPNLTWQDVGYILACTAKKEEPNRAAVSFTTHPNSGASTTVNLVDPWVTNTAALCQNPNNTAGSLGFNFHTSYGFGMVDALSAVKMAANSYTAPAARRSNNITAMSNSTITPIAASNFGRASIPLVLGTSSAITGPISLDITVANNDPTQGLNPGLLQFVLVDQNNHQSIMLPAFTSWYIGGKQQLIAANGGTQVFRFTTNAFYGQPLGGNWTVKVLNFDPNTAATYGITAGTTLTSYSI